MDAGVIGTGTMGRNHARVYSELKEVGTTYLYDSNSRVAEEVAAATGAEVCHSLEDLLRKAECVSVCVPAQDRVRVAAETIAAGVHTLIEKPLCLAASGGEWLLSKVPEEVVVGVGHVERFNPVVTEIAGIVQDPLYVSFHRHNPASPRVTGVSVIADLMIHDVDIVAHVLFPGEQCTIQASGTGDVAGALLTFGRTPVYLSASRKASKKVRLIYVEEEDRTIVGNLMTQEVAVYHKPAAYGQEDGYYRQENVTENLLVNKVEPLKIEVATFVRAACAGKPFPVTLEQGLANVRVCETIYQGLAA
jgi:UDP-N-acetylglucosamine 3-dehydrogenase